VALKTHLPETYHDAKTFFVLPILKLIERQGSQARSIVPWCVSGRILPDESRWDEIVFDAMARRFYRILNLLKIGNEIVFRREQSLAQGLTQ